MCVCVCVCIYIYIYIFFVVRYIYIYVYLYHNHFSQYNRPYCKELKMKGQVCIGKNVDYVCCPESLAIEIEKIV